MVNWMLAAYDPVFCTGESFSVNPIVIEFGSALPQDAPVHEAEGSVSTWVDVVVLAVMRLEQAVPNEAAPQV